MSSVAGVRTPAGGSGRRPPLNSPTPKQGAGRAVLFASAFALVAAALWYVQMREPTADAVPSEPSAAVAAVRAGSTPPPGAERRPEPAPTHAASPEATGRTQQALDRAQIQFFQDATQVVDACLAGSYRGPRLAQPVILDLEPDDESGEFVVAGARVGPTAGVAPDSLSDAVRCIQRLEGRPFPIPRDAVHLPGGFQTVATLMLPPPGQRPPRPSGQSDPEQEIP